MLDLNKPLRLFHGTQGTQCKIAARMGQSFFIQWGGSGHHYWLCNADGSINGHPSWRVENIPPEPVVQHCIAFLYNYRGSVCCGMVVSRAALDSFFVNNPGKLLTYKEVSFDYINPDKNF